jgi:hypothetical protein
MNSIFPAPEVFYDADRPLKLGYQTYLATPASYTFLLYALSGAAFAVVRCSHFTRNHRSLSRQRSCARRGRGRGFVANQRKQNDPYYKVKYTHDECVANILEPNTATV